jgi:hypothetical protein
MACARPPWPAQTRTTQTRILRLARFVSSRPAMARRVSGRGGLDLHRQPAAQVRQLAELQAVRGAPESEEQKEREQMR